MLTIKFYRQNGSYTTMAAARYSINSCDDRTYIWVYPAIKAESPVLIELHLREDEDVYYEMFVENMSGKTIDRARAISLQAS